jgi:CO/xanthine dehydrogenase Mo-binding subunit
MSDVVGTRAPRVGGLDRVTGRQAYVADIPLDDVLHVKLVTLPVARARIGRHRRQRPPAPSPVSAS